MSSEDMALRVDNISKCYEIYKEPHHRLLQTLFRGRRTFYKEFWALREVSFEIKRGECVGIIGRNGAGKSTLLQIVVGTLAPSTGEVAVSGKIGALLELGSGFNPEFTGRENVYMNGAVLGLSKKEVDEKFADIAAFADIGEFIDQPVKTYSTGMLVRLAFAVQTRVEPDILIVDEALSVGDEKFQRKCYQRFEELLNQGTTILLVTHATVVVERFCSKAILLDGGRLAAIGAAKEVIDKYHQLLYGQRLVMAPPVNAEGGAGDPDGEGLLPDFPEEDVFLQSRLARAASVSRKEGLAAQIDDVWLRKAGGGGDEPYYQTGESIEIGMVVSAAEDLAYLQAGMHIRTTEGVSVYGTSSLYWGKSLENVPPGSRCLFRISVKLNLCSGIYFISFAIADMSLSGEMNYFDKSSDALMFRVSQHPLLATGIVALQPEMRFELL